MFDFINQEITMSVYWDIILVLIGVMIPGIFAVGKKVYRNIQLKIRLKDIADIEDLNIVRISSGTPTYDYNNIHMNIFDKKLYIGFPENLKEKVLANDKEFKFHDDCSFDGSSGFAEIVKRTEIPDLAELIEKHRLLVADKFVRREDGCLFNRPKYGVYKIMHESRVGHDEAPEVKIELFDTDYFTHRVFRSIYNESKSRNHAISLLTQEDLYEGLLFKYNAFTTSIGMNAYVIADSSEGESVIFSRRAAGAAYSENRFKYNSTVMEGISQADLIQHEKSVSLYFAIERALHEELGLTRDHVAKYETRISCCDFFLEKNYFEIGITAVVKMNTVFEETIRDLPGKDKELEISKLQPVRKRKKEIENFISKEDIYPQGLFTLKMILARESVFINIKKNNIRS